MATDHAERIPTYSLRQRLASPLATRTTYPKDTGGQPATAFTINQPLPSGPLGQGLTEADGNHPIQDFLPFPLLDVDLLLTVTYTLLCLGVLPHDRVRVLGFRIADGP